MDAKHSTVNNGAEGHEVEDLATCFPDGGITVLLNTLFVETVDLGDLTGFMVSSDEGDFVGVSKEGQFVG